jgi:Protein of unknown function (DUF669)
MAVKKKSGKRFLEVDFTGVESGGKAVPDGSYEVEVAEVTEEESSEGNPYLKWKFRISEGPCKGSLLYENTSLQPQALWKLKGLLECLGEEIPDSTMKIDISDYVEKTMAVNVVNETYEGKERPRVTDYMMSGQAEAADEEPEEKEEKEEEEKEEKEETPAKKKKTTGKKAPAFDEGDKVKFTDDEGKSQKGTVVSVEDDTATVKVKDEEWEIQVSDLSAA